MMIIRVAAEATSLCAGACGALTLETSTGPAGLTARARPEAHAANLRSERGTYQDDRTEQRLIGLGRNCQPKQAGTPRSPVLVPGCPPFRDQRLWPARWQRRSRSDSVLEPAQTLIQEPAVTAPEPKQTRRGPMAARPYGLRS